MQIPVQVIGVDPVGTFETFPNGLYTLKVKSVKQDVAKASGEPKLVVLFEIMDGPDGKLDHRGKTIPRSYTLQPKGIGFFKRLLVACGVTDQMIVQSGGFPTEEMLIGNIIRASVTQREYNNRMTNDVQELIPEAARAVPQQPQSQVGQPPLQQPPMQPPMQQPMAPQPVPVPQGFTPPPTGFTPPPTGFTPPAQPGAWPAGAPGFPGQGNDGQTQQQQQQQSYPAPAPPPPVGQK